MYRLRNARNNVNDGANLNRWDYKQIKKKETNENGNIVCARRSVCGTLEY